MRRNSIGFGWSYQNKLGFFVDFTLSYYLVLKGAALGEENKKKGLKPATFEAAYSSVTVRNGEKFSKYCIIGLKLLQIQIRPAKIVNLEWQFRVIAQYEV